MKDMPGSSAAEYSTPKRTEKYFCGGIIFFDVCNDETN